jgi:hypothetical protein
MSASSRHRALRNESTTAWKSFIASAYRAPCRNDTPAVVLAAGRNLRDLCDRGETQRDRKSGRSRCDAHARQRILAVSEPFGGIVTVVPGGLGPSNTVISILVVPDAIVVVESAGTRAGVATFTLQVSACPHGQQARRRHP